MRTKSIGALSQEVEEKSEAIFREFALFSTGIRYVALLHRSKDGGHQGSEYHRRGGFYITHNNEQYRDALVRLLTLQAVAQKPYRLYASVNARDIHKAERAFKMDMLTCDFGDDVNKQFFWERLESKWASALMQPGSRMHGQSLFMLDVDGEGDVAELVLKWLSERGIDVVKQYKTPNGWHVVTPPFNPTEFHIQGCEIKKDGLLLLNS